MHIRVTSPATLSMIFGLSLAALGLSIAAAQPARARATAIQRLDYPTAVQTITDRITADRNNPNIRPACRPIFKSHGQPTAKAVVMLHGISSCPEQFAVLADQFHARGYTVYVPRVPQHGRTTNRDYARIGFQEMHRFMKETASIAYGLGHERGVIGLSGGGTMATWLTQHSDNTFSRALLLAPFYQPSEQRMPRWQAPILRDLYGRNLLPDRFSGDVSYRTLGKYMRLVPDYTYRAPQLRHVALIISANELEVDTKQGHDIPQRLARDNGATFRFDTLPASLGVYHDIVHPHAAGMPAAKSQLYPLYLQRYEGH